VLLLCGVVWMMPVGSRTTDTGFFGVRLPHLGERLMHCGCDTATGGFMQVSHSLFFLELGLLSQPMRELYQMHRHLVTHLWMKMFLEKQSLFEIQVELADLPI
jgi:hypothetical protein